MADETLVQTGRFDVSTVQVDQTVTAFMKKWGIPGGTFAVVRDGRLVYDRAFGYADMGANELVQPYSLFRIASLSKPITGIAIMKLMEEGRLTLEDRVFGSSGILNDATDTGIIKDPRALQITVRNLLQHTGGWDRQSATAKSYLVDGDPMFNAISIAKDEGVPAPADQTAIIKFMLKQDLDFNPDTKYAYSNFGYCILGKVIEKITGQPYESYVHSYIWDPLFQAHASSDRQYPRLGRNLEYYRAHTEVKYYQTGNTQSCYGTGELVPWQYGGWNLEAMAAHGGWVTSAADLLRLVVAVDPNRSMPPKLINPDTARVMVQTSTFEDYGMGWRYNSTDQNWFHNGLLAGTSSYIIRANSGISMIATFNQRSTPVDVYFDDMDSMLWAAVKNVAWPSVHLWERKLVIKHKVYEGDYQTVFEDVAGKGYHLISVNGYVVNNKTYFNSVFEKFPESFLGDGFHNLTADEYQKKFVELKEEGFRPIHIDTYLLNGQVRYAGSFLQTPGPAWIAHHGLAEAQHNRQYDEHIRDGYHLIQKSELDHRGRKYIASLYSK